MTKPRLTIKLRVLDCHDGGLTGWTTDLTKKIAPVNDYYPANGVGSQWSQ